MFCYNEHMNQDAKEAQQLYDSQAELFISKQAVNDEVHELRTIVYKLAGLKASDKILFAGCGDGVECVEADNTSATVTGVDISPKNIEHAQQLMLKHADFEVMDIQNLSFSDAEFDTVISILTVMYIEDLTTVLTGFKRIAKANGKIIIAVPHPLIKMMKYNAKNNYFLHGKQWEEWNGIRRFNYYRIFEDYSAAFNEAGLTIRNILEPEPISSSESVKYPSFIIFELGQS